MITATQKRMLDAIRDYQATHDGTSPSCEELAQATGISSKGAVHRTLVLLEERGQIRRLPNRVRAIEVIAKPLVHYPNAQYFTVERDWAGAYLVPLPAKK